MPAGGSYRLDEWNAAGEATLHANASSIEELFTAALTALLLVSRGESGTGQVGAEPDASVAIPIRGQGASFTDVFLELSGDLLAQVDANGTGLVRARMDGVLETDTGFTAWGYALGEAGGGKPEPGVSVLEDVEIRDENGQKALDARLSRSV